MQLSDKMIDLLEDTLVSGLKLRMGDADRFKKRFRKDPERFLVSLIISSKKDALLSHLSRTTASTMWHTIGEENLREARRLIEEWEKEPVAHE